MRRRTRLAVISAGIAPALLFGGQAIALSAPENQEPPTDCEPSALPVPRPDQYSPMLAGDSTGRIQVGENHWGDIAREPDVLMWTDGEPEKLDVPERTELVAVNSEGTAVGFVRVDGGALRPMVYRDGASSYLPGGQIGEATSINADGDIGGYLAPDGEGRVPVVWRSGEDQPERLPTTDGEPASVRLVADDGTAIGMNVGSDDSRRIYAWTPDGKTHELKPPPNGYIGVRALAGTRLVADTQAPDSNDNEPYEWDLRDLTAPPEKVETEIDWAMDVNTNGWMVGESGVWTEPRSVLFHSPEGGDLELPPLGAADETSEEVVALNEDGSILAGTSNDDNGNPRAVLWHCS